MIYVIVPETTVRRYKLRYSFDKVFDLKETQEKIRCPQKIISLAKCGRVGYPGTGTRFPGAM